MPIALLLHIALAFPPGPAVPLPVARAAVTEAAEIWSPYGVVIDRAAACGLARDRSDVLTVVAADGHGTSVWSGPLGAIAFAPDGTPGQTIWVFLTELWPFIGRARVLGATEAQWPRSLRDRIVGRALGRVLAHEVGHYLLRTRQHPADGLMRPQLLGDDLVSPARRHLTLSAAEQAQLAAAHASTSASGQAHERAR